MKKFGKKVSFEVGGDLLDDYVILPELLRISAQLEAAYYKSNSTAIKDLFKDIYESLEVEKKVYGANKDE